MQNASLDFIFLQALVIYSKSPKSDFKFERGVCSLHCIALPFRPLAHVYKYT